MSFGHATVLREESVTLLSPAEGRVFVDGTLGGGGHAELLLDKGARVIGLDKDPRALAAASERLARFGERFTPVHTDFRDVRDALDGLGIAGVDGCLVDLGVSSPQLDRAERGFSFQHDGPLDMRMDTTRGETLDERLDHVDIKELSRVIDTYGEERFARRIAGFVLEARAAGRIRSTRQLAEAVAQAMPASQWPRGINPATRTFQALRIWVNDELGALESWLDALGSIVAPGGRAAVIAFHSLEDRPVKRRFEAMCKSCICPPDLPVCGCGRTAAWRPVTRKAVVAGEAEVDANPRSRSAHLRCIERVGPAKESVR
jgi:16S rRNA (cytosine1402-N4)-methyltransferase